MKKILPNLYKSSEKLRGNNQKSAVLREALDSVKNVVVEEEKTDPKNINQKIRDIFNSPRYVYKADVHIELNDGTNLKKTIIGRTNNSLITIDDELIDVSKISKIEFD